MLDPNCLYSILGFVACIVSRTITEVAQTELSHYVLQPQAVCDTPTAHPMGVVSPNYNEGSRRFALECFFDLL